MKLDDALFNWLQIKVVADARPNDQSAMETADFFHEILNHDHQVTELVYGKEEGRYVLNCHVDGKPRTQRYDQEVIESLLVAIQNEPKYNS